MGVDLLIRRDSLFGLVLLFLRSRPSYDLSSITYVIIPALLKPRYIFAEVEDQVASLRDVQFVRYLSSRPLTYVRSNNFPLIPNTKRRPHSINLVKKKTPPPKEKQTGELILRN